MCASEYGQGRAIFIADNAFHDDFIRHENSPNDDLFLNILDWLTKNVNIISTFIESNIDFPKFYKLYQNYPNPFNPTTKIEFMLPKSSKVEIKIYNMLAQEIKTLVDRNFEPGNHVVIWNGRDNFGRIVGSGVYLYRMKTIDFISVKKGLFLK